MNAYVTRLVLGMTLILGFCVACAPTEPVLVRAVTFAGSSPESQAPAPADSRPLPAITDTGANIVAPTAQIAVGNTLPPATQQVRRAEAPTGAGVPFEVVAQGAPFVSIGETPVLVAIRGDAPPRAIPAGLPDEAGAALQKALAQPNAALYIVVFLGREPSTGYGVEITSIEARADNGLTVNYTFEEPDPAKGGASVMTYPYVIARVPQTRVDPADVTFKKS